MPSICAAGDDAGGIDFKGGVQVAIDDLSPGVDGRNALYGEVVGDAPNDESVYGTSALIFALERRIASTLDSIVSSAQAHRRVVLYFSPVSTDRGDQRFGIFHAERVDPWAVSLAEACAAEG